MRILVTGGKGQLGVEVTNTLMANDHQVCSYGRDELDITNLDEVIKTIENLRPEVIVHTAAYTQVDKAEQEVDQAYLVNAYGTRNIAVAAEKIGAKLIYISTDYVFDGESNIPYTEFVPTNPRTVYGKSKLAGEKFVQQLSSKFFILRTSWVYGKHGNNFVRTMLKLATQQPELRVVHDQVGCPTYTRDLAEFISKVMYSEKYGIYHVSNAGQCSWYEFAKAIFEETRSNDIRITPVTTVDFPRPAPRPRYSVFDHMAIRLNGFQPIRPWKDALKDYLDEMHND
ncbi:dTDP-4-dehydrorhamnose reductase [Brevibacillus migulae]|uniref:dTDP-4-dehydrorhamnose reductase n=1 Tax=Brevibacillus migulae TaxID=1644114 RepID=UPI00106DF1C7|nr:dTDP-4-dehydrorhamnose reductase [Brevibacillus migulae]